jgi:integrase
VFRRALFAAGVVEELPVSLKEGFGIPLDLFPSRLKEEVTKLMTWKQARYSVGRPKNARIRAESASNLRRAFCELYGFAVRVGGMTGIESVPDLVTSEIVGQYIEWAINERKVRGQSLSSRLVVLKALLGQHPDYRDHDFAWFSLAIDGIPIDEPSELQEKRLAKQVPYNLVESITEKIHRERRTAVLKGNVALALCVRNELIMLWLTVLPWRQRNIRECRIEGPRPNIFKAKIRRNSAIAKPEWVEKVLDADPEAEFWQFKFAPEETKVGNDVHALIPRPLIPLLEEYWLHHRKHLVTEIGAEALFLNEAGNSMRKLATALLVGELTLRYVGKCVTPHTFRHIVAYAWLDAHPQDYLTLSKILFHTNINTTLRCYGARFNESNGACGMERFVEGRRSKAA